MHMKIKIINNNVLINVPFFSKNHKIKTLLTHNPAGKPGDDYIKYTLPFKSMASVRCFFLFFFL